MLRSALRLSALLGLLLITAAPRTSPTGIRPAAAPPPAPGDGTEGQPPNLLLVVADDLGVDLVRAYDEHPFPARMPTLDFLASNGVLFRQAYSSPVCSPTRAWMLTGRFGFRTGIGVGIDYNTATVELHPDTTTLADVLRPLYRTVAFGKWHLAARSLSGTMHPDRLGFSTYAGAIKGGIPNYFSYIKVVDEEAVPSSAYATTETVDDALSTLVGLSEPWFAQVAFNAIHTPLHAPPDDLHAYDLPHVSEDEPLHGRAMAEALDTELGRLLASLDLEVLSRTVVVFVGDNGTPDAVTTAPFDPDHAKGTLYEGGIRVPLVIAGPGVLQGAECNALVQLTDLFATLAELGGGDPSTGTDSVSLVPYLTDPDLPSLRTWAYSEVFSPNGPAPWTVRKRSVRNDRYKLIVIDPEGGVIDPTPGDPSDKLYDLWTDPFEQDDLMDGSGLTPDERRARIKLKKILAELEASAALPSGR